MNARVINQVRATMPSRVGLLADAAEAVRDAGANVSAVMAYERDGMGGLGMITSDNAAAMDALRGLGADEVYEEAVVAVEMADEPGALAATSRKIADAGINIGYAYGTAGASKATIIFKTADADATVAAIAG